MDSPPKSNTLNPNLCFFFLFLSTNLLTLFLSSSLYSSCSLRSLTSIAAFPATDDRASFSGQLTSQSDELLTFVSQQSLPLGFNVNFGSDTIYSPVGRACTLFPDELRCYMSYNVNGSFPDDELLA
ncbi:hypothetical protein HRI_000431900 [Hibiscus trionum]|uniref:Uncharacterized protein n=1 Tax=Hibiscus trionum TaxID=183268 RepID=A0A9W7LKQ5_HIBTR|nr:hypothetical protein HRI_000431900 [Hibiscus trionum]